MNYIEACKALVDGKRVREKSWGKGDYIYFKDDNLYTNDGNEIDITISDKESMDSDNWEIYENEIDELIQAGKKWKLHQACHKLDCSECQLYHFKLYNECQKLGKRILKYVIEENKIANDDINKMYNKLKNEI